MRSGQVPLAPLCPFSTTQAPGGSGASGHALCGAQAALNSRLPRWEATGGPSQRGLPAPAGPEVNRTPAPQTSPATRTGRARSPRPDPPAASPAPAGRRRTAACCRGANFYTYFLFRFGFGVALAPPRIATQTLIFPPPGDVVPLAPRSRPAVRRTKFSPPVAKKWSPRVAARQTQQ